MNIAAAEIHLPAQGATAILPGFDFVRDRFAFLNELLWEYEFDGATGKMTRRVIRPKPAYALRCFVMTRATKQFYLHARFASAQSKASDEVYRGLIRRIITSSPRLASGEENRIAFPGYSCLYEFSQAKEGILKEECGGAWRSYVLRSHWRMVLPISRAHQAATADRLVRQLRAGTLPIMHLVTFPQLTMNHGVLLYAATPTANGWEFSAYDPNLNEQPMRISYDSTERQFSTARNKYWPGGQMKVIEIYRNWFF